MELFETAKEAIKSAGLDYKVVKRDLFTKVSGKNLNVRNHFATVRMPKDSTEEPIDLGVVGNYYTIVQNEEAFDAVDYANNGNEILFQRAGQLDEGAQIYVEGVLGGDLGIENTTLQKRLVLINSHDGTKNVVVKLFFYDKKNNTYLAFRLPKIDAEIKLRHSKSVKVKLDEGQKVLKLAHAAFNEVEKMFREMASRKCEKSEAEDFVLDLLSGKKDKDGLSARMTNMVDTIIRLLENRPNRTLFDVYLSIVDFVDNERGKKRDAELRISTNWFGTGLSIKERAFEKIVKMF